MAIDPSAFHPINVVDSCAVWNLLSSERLFKGAIAAKCSLCCTRFVYYECLVKPRKSPTPHDERIQDRFRAALDSGQFTVHDLSIDDLQQVALLEARKRLSKGELSSIAFAMRIGQAIITDDQKARKLAATAMPAAMVQTTPHLFGWLIFTRQLIDGDKDIVLEEHAAAGRPLCPHFLVIYERALEYRFMSHRNAGGAP